MVDIWRSVIVITSGATFALLHFVKILGIMDVWGDPWWGLAGAIVVIAHGYLSLERAIERQIARDIAGVLQRSQRKGG